MENLIQFNESEIDWKPAPGPDGEPLDHVSLSFLKVDENAKIVDLLFKFSANEKIQMHRHCSNYSTFTVQGELKTYYPDGSLKSVRPAGVFKAGTPGEPHTEGGGDEDVIVYTSGSGGNFRAGLPIGKINSEIEEFAVEFFSDLSQLSYVKIQSIDGQLK